jgi:peptidoglycan hydrolase CwlO-like protein
MKYIIVIINILTLSLIVYNLFVKSNNIIESLETCPKDKKDIIFKQEAKINNLFSQMNVFKNDLTTLKKNINNNNKKTRENASDIESTGKAIESRVKAKEKTLNDL